MKCPNCGTMNKFEVYKSHKEEPAPLEKVNKRHLICSECGLNFETTEVVTTKGFFYKNLDPSNPNNINALKKAQLMLFESLDKWNDDENLFENKKK